MHTNVYAAGELFATYDHDGLHFYANDWLGNRRVQTDYAGVPEQTCTNLPFGDSLVCSDSLATPTEHHFTGKERDTESGNDYFGARYYSSAMGRFMSPDWAAKAEPVPYAKVDNPQSLNLYAYMRNNPLGGVDPDGHCCEEEPSEEINESREANEELTEINESFNRREAAAADLREQGAVRQFNESHPGGYDDANGVSHVGPASRQDVEQMQAENRDKLFGSPTGAYKKPNNATTPEQRDSVQGKPCDTCGATGQKNNANHLDPLVEQHYRGGIDKAKMREPSAVGPQCPTCSAQQGGLLKTFSMAMKKLFGL